MIDSGHLEENHGQATRPDSPDPKHGAKEAHREEVRESDAPFEGSLALSALKRSVGLGTHEQCVVGIDPGRSGGVAVIGMETGRAVAYRMPFTTRDTWELIDLVCGRNEFTVAYIEKVHAMPKQGVTSMFRFGRQLGNLEMALIAADVRFIWVRPVDWQRSLGLIRKDKNEKSRDKKNRHKQLAQELFPNLKVIHAIADALLIAEFARRSTEP